MSDIFLLEVFFTERIQNDKDYRDEAEYCDNNEDDDDDDYGKCLPVRKKTNKKGT